MKIYVVIVFEPDSGDFDRVAGAYSTLEKALEVRSDTPWKSIHEKELDAPDDFVDSIQY